MGASRARCVAYAALALLCVALVAASAPNRASPHESRRLYDALSRLTFKNLGVIDKDLKLYNKLQCAFYRELEV